MTFIPVHDIHRSSTMAGAHLLLALRLRVFTDAMVRSLCSGVLPPPAWLVRLITPANFYRPPRCPRCGRVLG